MGRDTTDGGVFSMRDPDGAPGSAVAHILLIEDDPGLRRTLERVLQDAGYGVAAVGTLADARAVLAAGPEVVLCDHHLPDGLGTEFIAGLDPRGAPACILLTGDVPAGWPGRALLKPVMLDDLEQAIADELRARGR